MTLRIQFFSVFLVGLAAWPAAAQTPRFNVTGTVVDTSGTALPQATVVALTRADSVLTKFATSQNNGQFTLRRMTPGAYILQITFVGFQTIRHDFDITDGDVAMGVVTMQELTAELDELVVSADHIPFVVKRDTLEYNANAFTTRPGDVVEDLLRRLPGIEVEPDGTIKAQGEEVENVLVDGKEFFAETPTVATKNLPADAVDRVQVYDKASDQAEFSGIDDGEEEKTIDLLLKDGAKRGVLGSLKGGLGGEHSPVGRYRTSVSLHRFSPVLQSSLIGNASNTGQSGFGVGDLMSVIQSGATMMLSSGILSNFNFGGESGGGFTESINAGLNLSRDFGKRTWLRGSYFLNSLDREQDSYAQRHELAGRGAAARWNQNGLSETRTLGHVVNLNGQLQISPGHEIRLRSSLAFTLTDALSTSAQQTWGAQNILRNGASRNYDTRNFNGGGSSSLTWRKKISDKGRTVVARGTLRLSDSDQTAELFSSTSLAGSGNVMTWQELQQEQEQYGRSATTEQRISLTEPLFDRVAMELFGEHTLTQREEDKHFFNVTDGARERDLRLSNAFERTYRYWRGGSQFSWKGSEDRFTLGLNLQRSELNGTAQTGVPDVKAHFTRVLPHLFYERALGDNRDIDFRYRARTREPSLRELQPYTDNQDPLRTYVGNPALTPETSHSLTAKFLSFDQWTQISVMAFTESRYTHNQIVPSRTIDGNFRQVVSAVNSAGGWTHSANVNFGTPIRPLHIAVTLDNRLTWSTGREFINDQQNDNSLLRNSASLRVRNRNQDILELNASARMTYNRVSYSLNQSLGREYINMEYSGTFAWHLTYDWTLEADVRYRTYDDGVFGGAQNMVLMNLSVSKLLMNERVSLEFGVNDLLNQNLGVRFSNTATYVQEQRTETLGRYMMLRASWKLNSVRG
ncbi:MAG: TonB-dependent receptor [Bacteroidota bacterium]|nr:TonB-dependent receptor [Bacteroidota bacterium]